MTSKSAGEASCNVVTSSEGIAKAKREGHYKGRVPTARRRLARSSGSSWRGVRPTEIANRLGISRASVHRLLGNLLAAECANNLETLLPNAIRGRTSSPS
jgi:DNA invertase Pin-like site-specific DNA recombinase